MMHETHFTADWFTKYADVWIKRIGHLAALPTRFLEIGSYEGRSTLWLLENILTHPHASITCIDSWDGTDKTLGKATLKAKKMFDGNTAPYRHKMEVMQTPSAVGLMHLCSIDRQYDAIFVDGDHEGFSALSDLMLSWRLLKVGGYLMFDDYQWNHRALRTQPKDAWDAFVSVKPLGLVWELDGRVVFAKKEQA